MPTPAAQWQWQLSSALSAKDASIAVPAFDVDGFENSASMIASLHANGRRAICYIDAGTAESWRPDNARFPAAALGRSIGTSGERWVDIRALALRPILHARFAMCANKGFDSVEPDNIDGYRHSTGFPLTSANQLAFNRWIAADVHALGMSVAQKNDIAQVKDLVGSFDYAVVEECVKYAQCAALAPYVAAHKAVLNVEYTTRTDFCTKLPAGFSGMAKNARLTSSRLPCPRTALALAAGRWRPAVRGAWQIQFSDTQSTSANVPTYDLDGFDTTAATVSALRASGRHAICYISAGSWEDWRPDAASYPGGVLGRSNGWPGERWVDIRAISVLKPVIDKRLAMCRSKGFQAVDYDNVDGYTNTTGFPLTSANQLAFNRWIAAEAHAYGLSVGLKNDLDQIPELVGSYDFAINEQCHEYDECTALRPFVLAGKAVLQIEYTGDSAEFCPISLKSGFSTVVKKMDLSAWRKSC